jgi:hypothetical protein
MNPLLFVISYIDVRLLLYQDSLGKTLPESQFVSHPLPICSAPSTPRMSRSRACTDREWHRGLQAHGQRRWRRLCLIRDLEGKDGFLEFVEKRRRASMTTKARWSPSWPWAQAGPHRQEHVLCWHLSRNKGAPNVGLWLYPLLAHSALHGAMARYGGCIC